VRGVYAGCVLAKGGLCCGGECIERVCVVDPSRFPTVISCYPDRCSTVPLTLSL
jgi:hypothetical protein